MVTNVHMGWWCLDIIIKCLQELLRRTATEEKACVKG